MPPHATTTLGPYKDINFLNITDKIPEEYLSTALLGCTLSELVASPNLGCISNCLTERLSSCKIRKSLENRSKIKID